MPDQALSSMYVLLGLNTVDFETGAKAASQTAKDTADDIDESFGKLTESRHGLMVVEEMFGIRIPRSLNTLAAKIPGIGAAFAAILPIAGVALAIEIIGKLIAKHDELAAALSKAKLDAGDMAIKEGDVTK